MLKKHTPFHGITAIGLASSHPSACHVLTKYICEALCLLRGWLSLICLHYSALPLQSINLDFCQQNARAILQASPISYIQNMALCGSLFEDNCTSGAISSLFTSFYVDHAEPLKALSAYQARGQWLLGELLDGHEFLIILPI